MNFIFLIVTCEGFWGRGTTVEEAAINACVNNSGVQGMIFKLPDFCVKELYCGDFGSARATWSDEIFNPEWNESGVPQPINDLLTALWETAKVADGLIRYQKSKNRVIAEVS